MMKDELPCDYCGGAYGSHATKCPNKPRSIDGAIMSEPILGYCSVCGASGGGDHHPDCWMDRLPISYTRPPVYDLAEFERQLEAKRDALTIHGESLSLYLATALESVLECLKASKREAK